MSNARPCGNPSTMSIIHTSSARFFSATRRAAFDPTLPAPTTVTLLTSPPLRDRPDDRLGPQLLDDAVRHLGRTHRRRIVAVLFHVVSDVLAFGDDVGDRLLETVCRVQLLEVT